MSPYPTVYVRQMSPKVQVSAHNTILLCFLFVFAERGRVSLYFGRPQSGDVIYLQSTDGTTWDSAVYSLTSLSEYSSILLRNSSSTRLSFKSYRSNVKGLFTFLNFSLYILPAVFILIFFPHHFYYLENIIIHFLKFKKKHKYHKKIVLT